MRRFSDSAFDPLIEHIDAEISERFETLPITPQGVDWQAQCLQGPSATWTYLVNDHPFGQNLFLTLAVQPTFFLGAIVMWPEFYAWAPWRQVRNWRKG